MASGIVEIRDYAAALIAAATPDYDPGLPYIEAPYTESLDVAPLAAQAGVTRGFHVLAGPPILGGQYYCPDDRLMPQLLTVGVRYCVLGWEQAWLRLHNMAYSDAARIRNQLESPPATGWPGITGVEEGPFLNSPPVLSGSQVQPGLWVLWLNFKVVYRLEAV